MRNERLMEIKCKVIEQARGRAGVTTKALVLKYYVIVLLIFSGPQFSHVFNGW